MISDKPLTAGSSLLAPFSLRGRLGRVEFIAYCVSIALVGSFFLSALGFIFMAAPGMARALFPAAFSLTAYVLVPLVVAILAVRRLHDTGKPGWLVMLLLVPMVNLLAMLALALWPGNRESNAFGPPRPAPSTAALTAAVVLPLVCWAGFFASEPFEPSAPVPQVREDAGSAAPSSDTLRPYRP